MGATWCLASWAVRGTLGRGGKWVRKKEVKGEREKEGKRKVINLECQRY